MKNEIRFVGLKNPPIRRTYWCVPQAGTSPLCFARGCMEQLYGRGSPPPFCPLAKS